LALKLIGTTFNNFITKPNVLVDPLEVANGTGKVCGYYRSVSSDKHVHILPSLSHYFQLYKHTLRNRVCVCGGGRSCFNLNPRYTASRTK